jgi:hypothetical protein
MSDYYTVVCHTCRKRWEPPLKKFCEIAINDPIVAKMGRFLMLHNHHDVELVPESEKELYAIVMGDTYKDENERNLNELAERGTESE